MATRDPVTCTSAWTLVYDGTSSGVFTGIIQSSGATLYRVSTSLTPPVPLTGISSLSAFGGTLGIDLSALEVLYARALSGTVEVTLG